MKGIYGVRKRIISGIIALMMVVSLLPVSASAESECTEHSFGEWTVVSEADCTEAGVETRTCESCGETENCQTPALGHVYILGKCSRCGLEDASYIAPPELRITTATPSSAGTQSTACINTGFTAPPTARASSTTTGRARQAIPTLQPRSARPIGTRSRRSGSSRARIKPRTTARR